MRSVSEGLFTTASSSTLASFKLTHLFSQNRQVVARYSFWGADISGDVLGTDNFSDKSARGSSHNRDQSRALSWPEIVGPRFINEVRFEFARRRVDLMPNSEGPLLEIPGILSLGRSPLLNSARTEDHLQFVDNATFVRGNHQLGFGASLQHIGLDADLAKRFAGIFLFPTVEAFTIGTPSMFMQTSVTLTRSTEPFWSPRGFRINGGQ